MAVQPLQPSHQQEIPANSDIMTVLNSMQEAMKSKDDMISNLQETIRGLNRQIAIMNDTLDSLRSSIAQHGEARGRSRSTKPVGTASAAPAEWDGTF
jgi:hypothetical protein